ncbi:MAG: hypothetical protein AAF456_03545 [Planctomycetota bacterium]
MFSKAGRRTRNSATSVKEAYYTLEPRNLLAATLYVDFGLGMAGDFNITDTQSASVGGPAVFGSGFNLTSFTEITIEKNFEVDGNGTVDANDAVALANQTISALEQMFAPFDVDVVMATAADFADIQNSLSSTSTNDAYIFVGGSNVAFRVDSGVSVFDQFNGNDNLAFVFPDQAMPDNSFYSLYETSDAVNSLARAIGKQTGHTFGLASTEGGRDGTTFRDPAGYSDVMARPGRRADGSFFSDWRDKDNASFFTRQQIPLVHVNGVSNLNYSPFDKMVANVGLRANGPAYFTGSGADDDLSITSTGVNEVTVELNGETFEDVDISNGLMVELGFGRDLAEIDLAISDDVFVRSAWHLTFSGGAVNVVADASYAGTANGNLMFAETRNLITGDQADSFELSAGIEGSSIDSGGGDDFVKLNEEAVVSQILTGEGNDRVETAEGTYISYLLDMGEGEADVWDMSSAETSYLSAISINGDNRFVFGYQGSMYDPPYFYTNFELAIGNENGQSTVTVNGFDNWELRGMQWVIDGDLVTVTDPRSGASFSVQNFNQLRGARTGGCDQYYYCSPFVTYDSFYVLETDYEFTISNPSVVQLSSTMNPASGSTDGIDHPVLIDPSPDAPLDILVSNRGNATGGEYLFDDDGRLLIGDEGGALFVQYDTSLDVSMQLFGSEAGADQFEVRRNDRINSLQIFGGGGNDIFKIGSGLDQANGNLAQLTKPVTISGGNGVDRVVVNDQAASGGQDYFISEYSLTPYVEGSTTFAGLFFDDRLEFVRVAGTEFTDRFRVDIAHTTRFMIDGKGDDTAHGDRLGLYGTSTANNRHMAFHSDDDGATWIFSNRQSIIAEDMEQFSHVNRFATSAQGGGEPRVHVYDLDTGIRLRSFNAYGSGFRGGVNVAMADVNRDGIPDVITAPRKNFTIVKIFDGRNGSLIRSFRPYGPTYRGGISVAAGNVLETGGIEVLTSKLAGLPIVRVFSAELEQTNFQLVTTVYPFGFEQPFLRGSSLAVGDMNFDGVEDIISGAGPGAPPQVAIHDVSQASTSAYYEVQLNRFLAHNAAYRGGINVAVADIMGNPKPDLLVSAWNTIPASNPLAGNVFVFTGERLPRNNAGFVVSPTRVVEVNSNSSPVNLLTRSIDGGKKRLFTTSADGSKEVRQFDMLNDFQLVDSFFENSSFFNNGIGVG